ncbi:MAG TPA: T9SS type A sorting domain-containing protein [Bacteroidia bacterium]
MLKNYLFFLNIVLTFLAFQTQAQVITLGPGTFTNSNFAGPANTSVNSGAASRYAYIFPASMLNSLKHQDTILSLSFHKNAGGSIQGVCNMKIYMRMTVNANYGFRNINWVNQTSVTGMKKVYDKDPKNDIDSILGWVRFPLSTAFVVDTVFGKNLEILVEYTQSSAQLINTFWSFENGLSVPGYTSNQTKFVRTNGGTLTDTTNLSTDIHPSIRIEFPRYDKEIAINKLYSLGKIPIPQGNPDSVRAIVHNVGKKDQTFKIYLQSKGANKLIDSATYSIKSLEEKTLVMPLLYPTNTGLDTLTAFVRNDADSSNNSSSSFRLATGFVYSYKDPTQPIAGGIGFTGSTGDFVAKFYSASKKAINQISVSFSGSNQKFKLGIWAADGVGGKPGTLIWESDTLNPAPSFITSVDTPAAVNGTFYVGVRQIGTNNVGFGYQPDVPVRKNTFYYAAPLGDTNWVDFAPDAPFKFVIEPRLQAADDVAPIVYEFPKDTLWLANSKLMAPKATILNYGTNDQTTAFNVTMRIQRFNNQEFFSTRSTTLLKGQKKTITFDSAFYPLSAGQYDILTYTRLSNDQMIDNDTLRSRLIVAAFKDVGPGTIFDPSSGYDYEQFVDTIFPTVFVQNYGLDGQGPFNVRAEIFDSSNNLIYSDDKPQILTALNSVLVGFKAFPCDVKGKYFFRAFTELGIDVDKSNDTVSRSFKIVRSNDVALTSVVYPGNGKSYPPPVVAKRPEVILENLGDNNQAVPFKNYCEIYYQNNLIYKDSVTATSFRLNPNSVLFKNFTPTLKGYYKMIAFCAQPDDQFKKNDTIVSVFAVGVPDDVLMLDIAPAPGSSLELNRAYPTSVTVKNNGYNAQLTPFPVVFKVSRGLDLQYIKIIQVSLDSGETKTFNIDTTLMLNEPGEYDVQVYTKLNADFIKSNDTINGKYYTKKSKDISVASILYPTLSDTLLTNTGIVEPILLLTDIGDSAFDKSFKVMIRVKNANNGVQLYSKSLDTAFHGKDSMYLKFPGFSISNASIDVKIEAFTIAVEDQYHANDTAFSRSLFRIKFDPRAITVNKPAANVVLTEKTPLFKPEALIGNLGISILDSTRSICRIVSVDTINLNETTVYSDTIWTLGQFANSTGVVAMNKDFDASKFPFGVYKTYITVFSIKDQIFANNQVQANFRIKQSVSISVVNGHVFKLYPNPVSATLNIESDVTINGASLLDVSGRNLMLIDLNEGLTSIDVSMLSPGLYFINTGNGLIKFVVE